MRRYVVLLIGALASACVGPTATFIKTDTTFVPRKIAAAPRAIVKVADAAGLALHSVGRIVVASQVGTPQSEVIAAARKRAKSLGCQALVPESVFKSLLKTRQSKAPRAAAPGWQGWHVRLVHGGDHGGGAGPGGGGGGGGLGGRPMGGSDAIEEVQTVFHCVIIKPLPKKPGAVAA